MSQMSLSEAAAVVDRLRGGLRTVVRGRDNVIDLVLIALLADGHVLLEDYPGSGKTLLAKTLGESLRVDESSGSSLPTFRRIQFVPDLLPSDVTGTTVFDAVTSQFSFRPGPIFSHVVLADEINRASPKVQAALLEAMGEKQVTVDNETHALAPLFFVIATQNPIDLVGTYPLPVAQLDRFLFKISMTHLSREAELDVLHSAPARRAQPHVVASVEKAELLAARETLLAAVAVAPFIREALVDFARSLRSHARVVQGISTRSLVLAVPALQALALLQGREYVTPVDFETLLHPLFVHRFVLAGASEQVEAKRQILQECAQPIIEEMARRSLR